MARDSGTQEKQQVRWQHKESEEDYSLQSVQNKMSVLSQRRENVKSDAEYLPCESNEKADSGNRIIQKWNHIARCCAINQKHYGELRTQ